MLVSSTIAVVDVCLLACLFDCLLVCFVEAKQLLLMSVCLFACLSGTDIALHLTRLTPYEIHRFLLNLSEGLFGHPMNFIGFFDTL